MKQKLVLHCLVRNNDLDNKKKQNNSNTRKIAIINKVVNIINRFEFILSSMFDFVVLF